MVSGLAQHQVPTAEQSRSWSPVFLAIIWLGVLPGLTEAQDRRGNMLPTPARPVVGEVITTPSPVPGGTAESPTSSGPRPMIVGLPQLREGPSGHLMVEPNVTLSGERPSSMLQPAGEGASPTFLTGSWWNRLRGQLPESLGPLPLYEVPVESEFEITPEWIGPPLDGFPMGVPPEHSREPIFGRILQRLHGDDCDCCRERGGPLARRLPTFGLTDEGGGIGRERLAMAPFELDIAQPQNNFRFRMDFAGGFRTPDRAEYFFAGPNRGPPIPETSVDYQDLRFLMEAGGPKFSVATEVPIRILDPVRNGNTAGLSDLNVTTKVVLLDGNEWQLTQIFRTYMNTGAPGKGLGTGHISIEPGLLARYRASEFLNWHGVLQYWVPLGGDPNHSGEILKYGIGLSHLLYDSDTFAIIDTFEVVGWTVLDGQRTDPLTGIARPVDGEGVIHLYPGLRFVRDTGGDLGLIEFGVSGTLGMGNSRWLDDLVRLEFRVLY